MAWFESHLNSGGSGGGGNFTDSAWDGSVINNCYIASDGTQQAYNGWSATDYINIEGTTKIYRWSNISSASYNAWYDSNKNFISFFGSSEIDTVPNNAKYVRYSSNTQLLNGKLFTEVTS